MSARDTPENHEYVPEAGWDWEPCLRKVQENDRFVTYCARWAGHTGKCNDAAHPMNIGLPDELVTELEVGLGLVEGSRQYDTAINAAEITLHYYGRKL